MRNGSSAKAHSCTVYCAVVSKKRWDDSTDMSLAWYWSCSTSKRSSRTRLPRSCTNSSELSVWIGGTWEQPNEVCGRVEQAAGVSAGAEGPGQQRHSAPEVMMRSEFPGTRWRISLTCRP